MAARSMRSPSLRPFDPHRDRAAVARLWASALGDDWPVLPDAVDRLGAGHVLLVNRSLVGMIAVDPRGSITFLAVEPAEQRRGHGTRLVGRALDDFRRDGLAAVRVGSGGDHYVWPGVPTSCTAALAFFERLGWAEDDRTTDLVQDLRASDVVERMEGYPPPDGVDVAPAGPRLMADVIAFEDTHFPQWSRYFREPHDGVLIARDRHGSILGSLLLDGPGRTASPYWPLLGDRCGAIGCVGVMPEQEGRGIGTAMVAAATRLLVDRGVHRCLIDWVVRVDFYGRLGYRPWRTYSMRSRGI
ncbi:MAG TPA: GNAT family N-acetyltransferase [Acidimicrobiales bacterium]|nr:GNAT family N-acetyltransferase [Acidimicrobiales bacterium]